MISIIIASADQQLFDAVSKNIEGSIGVPYEIIKYENSNGAIGLCELYNAGARKAKYDLLCYMHEDIAIKTSEWGQIVQEIFEKNKLVGVVGVAGSAYKTYAPSGWDVEGNGDRVRYINYIQLFKRTIRPSELINYNPSARKLAKVVCVDGMWFCTRKDIVLKHPFDEDLLKGFHGYDIDFCLSVNQFSDIVVTFDVLLEHFSEGGFNQEWLIEILKIHEKWLHTLPVSINYIPKKEQLGFEKRAYKSLVINLLRFGFKKRFIWQQLLTYKKLKKISFGLFVKLNYYMVVHSFSK